MTFARNFGSLAKVAVEVFNMVAKAGMKVSRLKGHSRAFSARVCQNRMVPFDDREDHCLGECNFPLCQGVVSRFDVTNDGSTFKLFDDVSFREASGQVGEFVSSILICVDPFEVDGVIVNHIPEGKIEEAFKELRIVADVKSFL